MPDFLLTRLAVLTLALALDLIIGDPQNPLHPMRIIGYGISLGTKVYRQAKPQSHPGQYLSGVLLTSLIIVSAFALTYALTLAAYWVNTWLGLAVEAVICYFLIAPKSLRTESMKVHESLVADDIIKARQRLSMIVGRDTESLPQPEIVKATVETVAENFSDGVLAPLLFICVGGAPIGMVYKAINTLDSMIGYKTEEFMYFGRFAARLDDFVNYIPARIAALLMIFGSLFAKADASRAARVFFRDRHNHASPNSAQTISACAGALGLCLGGDAYYHGKLVQKPKIGDAVNELLPAQIITANRLMYSATFCAFTLMAIGLVAFILLSFALTGLAQSSFSLPSITLMEAYVNL